VQRFKPRALSPPSPPLLRGEVVSHSFFLPFSISTTLAKHARVPGGRVGSPLKLCRGPVLLLFLTARNLLHEQNCAFTFPLTPLYVPDFGKRTRTFSPFFFFFTGSIFLMDDAPHFPLPLFLFQGVVRRRLEVAKNRLPPGLRAGDVLTPPPFSPPSPARRRRRRLFFSPSSRSRPNS